MDDEPTRDPQSQALVFPPDRVGMLESRVERLESELQSLQTLVTTLIQMMKRISKSQETAFGIINKLPLK